MPCIDFLKLEVRRLDLKEQNASYNNLNFVIRSINILNIHKENINGIMLLLIKLGILIMVNKSDSDDKSDNSIGELDDNMILLV